MEPNMRDFDTEYLLGCVNVGRVSRFWRCRLPQHSLFSHLQLISPPKPQSSSSLVRLTVFLLKVPGNGVQLQQDEIWSQSVCRTRSLQRKHFLNLVFTAVSAGQLDWMGLVASHCSRNSKQDLKQINEPKTGIPGAPGQWPPSFPRRDGQPTLWDRGPNYRLIRWDISSQPRLLESN